MTGKLFISYRREDSPDSAGRLYESLEPHFGVDRLFMDIDKIQAGSDFAEVLRDHLEQSDVVLAVIGPKWLTVTDAQGLRRLDDPNDWVRLEIVSALEAGPGKRVVPVLVGGADMPKAEALGGPLAALAGKQALRLRPQAFRQDAQGLIRQVEIALDEIAQARAKSADEQRLAEKARRKAEAEQAARHAAEEARARREGRSQEEVRKLEELASWEHVKSSTQADALRDHLARYPQGATAEFAYARLEEIVWSSLGPAPRMDQLRAFLDEFPRGRHADMAQTRLQKLRRQLDQANEQAQRQASEAQAFAAVAGSTDISQLTAFIADHPHSRHVAAAQTRITELRARARRRKFRLLQGAASSMLVMVLIVCLGLGIVWFRLGQGPVGVGFLTGMFARQLALTLGAPAVDVEDAVLMRDDAGALQMRLRGFRLRDGEGLVLLQAPLVAVSLQGYSVFLGETAVDRLELIEPQFLVSRVAKSGRPALDPSSLLAAMPTAIRLREIRARNARLLIEAGEERTIWHLPEIEVKFDDMGRSVAASATLAAETGPWQFQLRGRRHEGGRPESLQMTLRSIIPRQLARSLPEMSGFSGVDTPVAGDIEIQYAADGSVATGKLLLETGQGRLHFPWLALTAIEIESGRMTLAVNGAARRLEIATRIVPSRGARTDLTGAAVQTALAADRARWVFDVAASENMPPAQQATDAASQMRGFLALEPGGASLQQLSLREAGKQLDQLTQVSGLQSRALVLGTLAAMVTGDVLLGNGRLYADLEPPAARPVPAVAGKTGAPPPVAVPAAATAKTR